MASKVFYSAFEKEETLEGICEKTRHLFGEASLHEILVTDRPSAIKTHFGEKDNDSYIPPEFIRAIADEVRVAGADPCLVETSTLYRGERSNALDHFNLAVAHGFGPEAMGCPLLFLDGMKGNMHVKRPVDLDHFDSVAVAADFTLFPSATIVTHLTGHVICGFAGAIKNVAMGLSSRAGKMQQHSAGRPEVKEEECISCGTCARWCPEDAITVGEKAEIDYELCIGCGECVAVCPVGAVGFSWDEPAESFNEKMAEYACGILADKRDSVAFITFIYKTTDHCNCMGKGTSVVGPDLGVLASRDPVAIDRAAADLVNERHGGDLFEETWPGKHWEAQLVHGEHIGLGSQDYGLIRV